MARRKQPAPSKPMTGRAGHLVSRSIWRNVFGISAEVNRNVACLQCGPRRHGGLHQRGRFMNFRAEARPTVKASTYIHPMPDVVATPPPPAPTLELRPLNTNASFRDQAYA